MKNIERVNQKDGNCIVCGKPLVETIERFGQKADVEAGTKHHISYFPEKVAWVHQKCHDKIHDPKNPITYLIQYEEGDSEKFYKIQNAKK
jgi:hypothetical protein